MRTAAPPLARRLAWLLAAALALPVLGMLTPREAWAHGGRIQPRPPLPGGGGPPTGKPKPPPPPPDWGRPPITPPSAPEKPTTPFGPPTPPTAPPPPAPATPEPGAPTTGTPTTGTGTPRGRTAPPVAPESRWQTWWALNRWSFLRERGASRVRPDAVVTPAGPLAPAEVDADVVAARRRALVARQHTVPFLLRTLDPTRPARDEVRAAALLALAKIDNGAAARALLMRTVGDTRAAHLVRESAALGIGLLRRTQPQAQLPGEVLDGLRTSLLGVLDDADAGDRTRAFAAFALGLLADQPYGSPFSKGGRVVTRALATRLEVRHAGRDVGVALLTALGLQPREAAGRDLREALERIVLGRRALGRSWDAEERSHALLALARHDGADGPQRLVRTLADRRSATPVRRAAFIATGAGSGALDPGERLAAVEAVFQGVRHARDPLSRGLAAIALGRLLGEDLQAGSTAVLERTEAAAWLLAEARNGPAGARGFAALGLALAARGGVASEAAGRRFADQVAEALLQHYERTVDDDLKGAFAVGLGLMGAQGEVVLAALTATLEDRGASGALRGHAAVALAQTGVRAPAALRALRTALLDRRSPELRSEAALALSFLGDGTDAQFLLQELRGARSPWVLAQIAAAVGQLDDASAVPQVMALADDERREDEARALAIVALGLLGDPERRPSLLRLTRESNYPAATDALWEAFTIL